MDILIRWRKSQGLSQSELARVTGVPRRRTSHYENGDRLLSLEQARKLQAYANRNDLIITSEHFMPHDALELFTPPPKLEVTSEPNRAAGPCAPINTER